MSESVLVTGASRGIGAAIAGAVDPRVVRFGTCRPSTLEKGGLDSSIQWIDVDFATPNAAQRVVERLQASPGFSGLRGLVLCAGVVEPECYAPSPEGTGLPIENISVNLVAPLQLVHALVAAKCFAPRASIVMVGSNLARRGLAGKVSYSAAKAGLEGATRALAHELGPSGIRVNTVAPGLIETDMTKDFGESAKREYAKQVPLRRVGQPQDVAAVVQFFLSDAADYVTGQVLDVDGGWGV